MRENGQKSTARDLFERHHPAVFRFLRRMAGSREAAEDLLQETFLRVVRAQRDYREEGQGKAWLFRIARNVLLNRRRDLGRRPEAGELAETAAPAQQPRPVEKIGLRRALESLEENLREAFLLREVGGLGYVEIATACDATPDAVRNRIYRARMELRRALTRAPGLRAVSAREERTS